MQNLKSKNSPVKINTTLKTKIALIMFGLSLFFVFLEVGLRLSGFVLLSVQEYRNRQTMSQKGVYRIMCLGESTTQNQYPRFLEGVLNRRNIGVRFSVADAGRGGANTSFILSQVESYLNEYHPNLVVAMMGINDHGKHIPYEAVATSKTTFSFKSLKTYKLARLLWLHILAKTSSSEDLFKKAIDLNPKNDKACFDLGWIYQEQGDFFRAEELFKRSADLNPKNYKVYMQLGWLYREFNRLQQAEDSFRKAIELDPKNDDAYVGFGWFCLVTGKSLQADEPFKKAIELNPRNHDAYVGLGQFYLNQNKFSQAEDLFKKAVDLNPKDVNVYLGLGWIYRVQGKFSQAEDSFKKAIDLIPQNELSNGAISGLYEEIGKPELAKEYAEKVNRLGYYRVTVDNYRKLKEILYKRGIRLVCVQYPMRSLESLKKIFKNDDAGLIFVDNEAIFKEEVKKSGFKEIFSDMFAGDFGHCTGKGNRILAENIGNVILKEVFSK